jgi:RNA polymerase sigma factor FliA
MPGSHASAGCVATRAIKHSPTGARYPSELAAQREALILRYTELVKRIAFHLFRRRRYVAVDDLIRAGRVGLLQAIREYGQERAGSFESYVNARIREAMLEFVRDSDWSLRALRGALRGTADEVKAFS